MAIEYLSYVDRTCLSLVVTDSCTASEPAALLTYDWTVSLPAGAVPGVYHLGLVQNNQLTASPSFTIVFPPVQESSTTSSTTWTTITPTANATLISAPIDPTHTVTYWDHACKCTTTKVVTTPCPTATATATNLPGAHYTWWDEHCGCTKSAVVPGPTTGPGSNWTAPTPTPNLPPSPSAWTSASAAPSGWTGDANKLIRSSFGVVALLAAAILA